jgi:hypothetical protein
VGRGGGGGGVVQRGGRPRGGGGQVERCTGRQRRLLVLAATRAQRRRRLLLAQRRPVRVLLHETVDLEPVGAAAVAAAGLGHADGQAFAQAARLTGGAVPLVHHAAVGVLAVGNRRLVVAKAAEEGLAALAGEGAEVEAGGLLLAHAAQLILQRVNRVDLKRESTNYCDCKKGVDSKENKS